MKYLHGYHSTTILKWIVIDDFDLHNEEIRKHQILTDASIGLTVENICEAERLLL